MKKLSPFLCICALFFSFCERSSKQVSDSKKTSHNSSNLIFADSLTFFPLSIGSIWHYEEFMEGAYQPGNGYTDSAFLLTVTDSGIIYKVLRIDRDSPSKTLTYFAALTGIVYIIDGDGTKVEYCSLHPAPSQKIGDRTYSKFLDQEQQRIRLETSDYENSSYEQQMEWQGTIFERGTGIISAGASESGMELVEYRIGATGTKIVRKSIP